jgi:glyoxylase-like metal-dependent hydrolase (beta-lactamase superfamily II)
MDEVFSPIDMAPTVYATELLEAARRKRDIPFIDKIFISHAHADHFGDPTAFSQDVPIIYGPGTRAWLNSDSPILQFPRKYLETRDIHEVGSGAGYGPGEDKKWQKVGPFEQGWDYFGDGSLWLIPAPGVSSTKFPYLHISFHWYSLSYINRCTLLILSLFRVNSTA